MELPVLKTRRKENAQKSNGSAAESGASALCRHAGHGDGAEEYAGSFVLVAMNANSTIVEPTRIQYKSGQTIQQALADSDIDFVGLENGFVYEIERRFRQLPALL